MSLILAKNISEFKNFSHIDSKLMIYERNAPQGSVTFLKNLLKLISQSMLKYVDLRQKKILNQFY